MTCPYCNAELDDSLDRCTTCLKHQPHKDIPAPAIAGTDSVIPEPLESSIRSVSSHALTGAQTFALIRSGLVTAVVVAGIYFAITRVIDLFLIFPLVAGAIVGAFIAGTVTKHKIRNAAIVGVVGLLAGISTYVLKTGFEAYSVRPLMVASIARSISDDRGIPVSDATQVAERIMTPWMTMKLYLLIMADHGISIGAVGSSVATGLAFRGAAYWLLLIGECSLVTWLAFGAPVKQASAPFCEDCRTWRKVINVIFKHHSQSSRLIELARTQDWAAAVSLPPAGAYNLKNMSFISAEYCPKCSQGAASVTSIVSSRSKTLFRADIPEDSLAELRATDKPVVPVPAAPIVTQLDADSTDTGTSTI